MKCSIVMSTWNKDTYLSRVLRSIRIQDVPFEYEIVVVDDGSTDSTANVCTSHNVEKYIKLDHEEFRNPAIARNVGYKAATGDIIIAQSDDVIHHTEDTVEQLCNRLRIGEFLIATVFNYNLRLDKRLMLYTGMSYQRPFFFLGSLWREDLYKIGGNDEEFTGAAYDDDWFGDCLTKGLGLGSRYLNDVIGYHQDHPRPYSNPASVKPSRHLYGEKVKLAKIGAIGWESSGGPWKYDS